MYDRSAAYYDLIYRDLKDYRAETSKIDTLLKRFSPQPHRLLDVGCGTGEHALRLQQTYGYLVDGVDIQPSFIEIAQLKLPSSRFQVADMRNFDLGQKYDAVLCLFSSIGYTETLEGLAAAFSSFALHLKPDGVLICEPWVTAEFWTPGIVDVTTATDPKTETIVTRTREGSTEGTISVLRIEYEIQSSSGLESFTETHRLGLFSLQQIEEALEAAGFDVNWEDKDPRTGSRLIARRRTT